MSAKKKVILVTITLGKNNGKKAEVTNRKAKSPNDVVLKLEDGSYIEINKLLIQ